MNLASLAQRLTRLEGRQGVGRITAICNLANHPPAVVAEAIRDWRAWAANGRVRGAGSTLILRAERLTAAEWSARYNPRPRSLS
ncbi:hypothetical protein [Methylobacterium sp. SD21]|uniref:hypothetical protein n=1 Tax=Methylobacterium litchii TaxID=3138810 RepID=UPI00313AD936